MHSVYHYLQASKILCLLLSMISSEFDCFTIAGDFNIFAPLSQIMRNNQIAHHSYADDTQIYPVLSPNDYSPIDSLCQYID